MSPMLLGFGTNIMIKAFSFPTTWVMATLEWVFLATYGFQQLIFENYQSVDDFQ